MFKNVNKSNVVENSMNQSFWYLWSSWNGRCMYDVGSKDSPKCLVKWLIHKLFIVEDKNPVITHIADVLSNCISTAYLPCFDEVNSREQLDSKGSR